MSDSSVDKQRSDEDLLGKKELEFVKELGLDINTYRGVFVAIFKQWREYFDWFLRTRGLMKICKTPQDLQRVSETLYPLFDSIYKRGDGSASFLTTLSDEIGARRITTVDELIDIAQQLTEKNEIYWNQTTDPKRARDGRQFDEYLTRIRIEKRNEKSRLSIRGILKNILKKIRTF